MNQYEHIITDFLKIVQDTLDNGVDDPSKLQRGQVPFKIPRENYFKRPLALENIKQMPCYFFGNGQTRRNENISHPIGYIPETLELLLNIVINPIENKDIIQRASDIREAMRVIIAASQRVGNVKVDGRNSTKEVRLRRSIPFRARRDRRVEKDPDRELILFIIEIDFIHKKAGG